MCSHAMDLCVCLEANVLCYEYTGYGLSDGTPSERSCYADIRAAFDYLRRERSVPAEKIVLLGRSLGSGPSIFLAAEQGKRLGGLIVVGAPASVFRTQMWTRWTLCCDMFPNVERIGAVKVPVLHVQGVEDTLVSMRHRKEMLHRISAAVWPLVVEGAGHNNLDTEFRDVLMLNYRRVLCELGQMQKPAGKVRSAVRRLARSGALTSRTNSIIGSVVRSAKIRKDAMHESSLTHMGTSPWLRSLGIACARCGQAFKKCFG